MESEDWSDFEDHEYYLQYNREKKKHPITPKQEVGGKDNQVAFEQWYIQSVLKIWTLSLYIVVVDQCFSIDVILGMVGKTSDSELDPQVKITFLFKSEIEIFLLGL